MIFVAVFVSTFCLTLVKVGAGYAPLPLPFFLPVTQNYHEAPILETLNLAFCCGCPYEKKSRNLVLPPSQSTLKYGSENRSCLRGLRLAWIRFCRVSTRNNSSPSSSSFFSAVDSFFSMVSNILWSTGPVSAKAVRMASNILNFAPAPCPPSSWASYSPHL